MSSKAASQLTSPCSKAGGPAQHQIVTSQFLFSPAWVHAVLTQVSQLSSPSQVSMVDSSGHFARWPMSCHGHPQSNGERGCSARGQAWWLLSIMGANGPTPPRPLRGPCDDCSSLLKSSHTHMHAPCSSLKFCTPFPCTQKRLKKSSFLFNLFSTL